MVSELQALAHTDVSSHSSRPVTPLHTLHSLHPLSYPLILIKRSISPFSHCTSTPPRANHFPFHATPTPSPSLCSSLLHSQVHSTFQHSTPSLFTYFTLPVHPRLAHHYSMHPPSTGCSLHSAHHPLHCSAQAFPPSRSLLHSQSSSLPILLFLHLYILCIPSAHPLGSSHLSFHPSFRPTCACSIPHCYTHSFHPHHSYPPNRLHDLSSTIQHAFPHIVACYHHSPLLHSPCMLPPLSLGLSMHTSLHRRPLRAPFFSHAALSVICLNIHATFPFKPKKKPSFFQIKYNNIIITY